MDSHTSDYFTATGPTINKFSRLRKKRERLLNRLRFLVSCKNSKIVPRFVNLRYNGNMSFRIRRTLGRCQQQLLRTTIQDTRSSLSKVEAQLYKLHLLSSNSLHPITWNAFDSKSFFQTLNDSKTHRSILEKKFKCLKSKTKDMLPTDSKAEVQNFNDSPIRNPCVVNLSTKPLDSNVTQALSLGLNFAIQKKPVHEDTIVCVEKSFRNSKISTEQKEALRSRISSILQHNNSFNRNVNNQDFASLKIIQKDPNLIVTKADKGGQIVVMDSDQYHTGLNSVLSEGPYTKVKKDPTASVVQTLKQNVKKSNILSAHDKIKLIPSNYHLPRMYCLPKIHKPGNPPPFRPIVSSIGSPTYDLSKFLTRNLTQLTKSDLQPNTVSNSVDFVNRIGNWNSKDCIMLSFDVKSLFTNVPVHDAISCLELRLLDSGLPSNTVQDYIDLVSICVSSNYFTANSSIYQQTDGLAMGNPLSPLLSDIYMQFFETKIINNPTFPLKHCR